MKKITLFAPFLGFLSFLYSLPVRAQVGVEDISTNIINSAGSLPGLLSAFMYLAGLILLVTGLIKLKEHVDNEKQTPLRVPVIRLIAGGMCLALPFLTQVLARTINNGNNNVFDGHEDGAALMLSQWAGFISAAASLGTNVSSIFSNIGIFASDVSGLVSAVAYLLAMILMASGILKLKEHVEEPEKITVKEPVTRFLASGALFGLPYVFTAIYTTIAGSGAGVWDTALAAYNVAGFLGSSYEDMTATGFTCAGTMISASDSLGSVLCYLQLSTIGLPSFLMGVGYLLGMILIVWGVLKLRDHVLAPSQTKLSEGVTRLLAGGAFFALPIVSQAVQSTMTPIPLVVSGADHTTSFAGDLTALECTTGTSGLDRVFGCLMMNVMGPTQMLLNFFAFCGGLIFMMVGISRLIKSAQDGPRGPGGLGTIATFVAAGVLMSGTTLMAALSSSLFQSSMVATKVTGLGFGAGLTPAELQATYNTISAVLRFMIIIGLVSFVRGVFILRDSAEGKSQASIMSGMTHIIGGALAVNLGPLLNSIQYTLGITAYGITFG